MDGIADERFYPGPGSPRASEGVVDVWRADLAAAADGLAELLCAGERARARRIVPERPRALWPRSRGMLRALLARYLDEDPRGLRFESGPLGKPTLRRRAGRGADLRFNLAHSGAEALVAIAAGREVGADVQCAATGRAWHRRELAIATRVFGSAHARRLGELQADARTRAFLRAWTEHEAALKCAGSGLRWARAGGELAAAKAYWATPLGLGPGTAAAVAAEGPEQPELRCFQWLG